jgi:hypothetical protein
MASKMKDQGGMMGKVDRKELMTHLQDHIMYPASRRTIIEACNQMSHVPAADRSLVEQKLPEGIYQSADEVVMKLGM